MKKKYKRLITVGVIILLVPASLLICDDNRLVVTRYDVTSDNLPPSFDGFTIVQVSDFHNEAIDYSNANIIESIVGVDPDIILITGDFIDETTRNFAKIEAFLTGLEDYLILYENGNHDIHARLYDDFLALLGAHGVINVSGGRYALTRGADQLSFIGVEQAEVDDDWGMFTVNIDPVLTQHVAPLLDESDDYRVLLSHHPNFYAEAATLGMDLMLSGHYHGGHMNLFGWSPVNMIDEKFSGGQFDVQGMELVVSRGAGSGLFPIRINCPSEIVVITLKTSV